METLQKNVWDYRFQEEGAADETLCSPFDSVGSTCPFPSSRHHKYNKDGYENALTQLKEEEEVLTRRLSPSSLRPVSFKWETINGHIPMMLAAISTK